MSKDSSPIKSKTGHNAIGIRLRGLREQANLTQEELGFRIGKTKTAISNIEGGRNGARMSTLTLIAEALGIEVQQILTNEPLTTIKPAPGDDTSLAALMGSVKQQGIVELRFVPVSGRAAFAEMGGPDTDFGQLDTIAVPLMPGEDAAQLKSCLVFEVNGDSMEPTLQHGQRVIAEGVNEADWEYQSDRVYVVSYAG
ncbi:MAG TPA: helix-turn-helix domain-containing protein, partial [Hymenobacter sp.]